MGGGCGCLRVVGFWVPPTDARLGCRRKRGAKPGAQTSVQASDAEMRWEQERGGSWHWPDSDGNTCQTSMSGDLKAARDYLGLQRGLDPSVGTEAVHTVMSRGVTKSASVDGKGPNQALQHGEERKMRTPSKEAQTKTPSWRDTPRRVLGPGARCRQQFRERK